MLAPDPAAPSLAPALSPALAPRDKRQPYLSHRGASPDDNFNCAFPFNRGDQTPEAAETIACCHLALLYCERASKNPDFHPSEFFDGVDPREEEPSRLRELLLAFSHYCSAWHLLPSRRFGDFLRQAFEDLIAQGQRSWAVYLVHALSHSMALRLRVKTRPDGTQELVVQVYDPNQTKVHGVARVSQAKDWGSEGQAHDFLSFLCLYEGTPSEKERQRECYFGRLDPEAHIALFEIRAEANGEWVKHEAVCPLVTNWCTNPRIQMLHAMEMDDQPLLDTAIEAFFRDPAVDALRQPGQLLEVPRIDHSVLQYLLLSQQGAGQATWEACWQQTQNRAMKVRLLRGPNKAGEHLLLAAHEWNPQALRWWLGLVATLPAQDQLEVLKIDDQLGQVAMECWVINGHDIVSSAWPSVVKTLRAERPADMREVVASIGPDGAPMLTRYAEDEYLDCLRQWGHLLSELGEDDLVHLLLAQDRQGVSALHHAVAAQRVGWIGLWGQWWRTAPAASQARLLRGPGPRGESALWALARQHHPATFEAWAALWRQLPEAQRADVLGAQRESAPAASVLYRAMTGAQVYPEDTAQGSPAFIEQWGACLQEVPPEHRATLLQGTPNARNWALRRALWTGHWAAVVAWAGLLRWVTPAEREALTELTEDAHHPFTVDVRSRARKDPAAYHAALQALRETLPERAWAWMQAQAPAQ